VLAPGGRLALALPAQAANGGNEPCTPSAGTQAVFGKWKHAAIEGGIRQVADVLNLHDPDRDREDGEASA
jgi:hypothetical protein